MAVVKTEALKAAYTKGVVSSYLLCIYIIHPGFCVEDVVSYTALRRNRRSPRAHRQQQCARRNKGKRPAAGPDQRMG